MRPVLVVCDSRFRARRQASAQRSDGAFRL